MVQRSRHGTPQHAASTHMRRAHQRRKAEGACALARTRAGLAPGEVAVEPALAATIRAVSQPGDEGLG